MVAARTAVTTGPAELESGRVRRARIVVTAFLAAILLSLLPAAPAGADFQAGWRAYQGGDFATAFKEWRADAEAGNARAQYNLGYLYYRGKGVKASRMRAARWWRKAAEQGVVEAQHNLALAYLSGDGVEADPAQALYWIELAATNGLARSQYTLGKMYLHGVGIAEDAETAFEWILRAAEQGEYRAQYNLGKIYRDGRGVAASEAESIGWFRRAAEQGYAKAQNRLGVRYARGQGVGQDDVEALMWVLLAADQGDKEAVANRQPLLLRMPASDIARARELAAAFRPHVGAGTPGGKATRLAAANDDAATTGKVEPASLKQPAEAAPAEAASATEATSVEAASEPSAAAAPPAAPPAATDTAAPATTVTASLEPTTTAAEPPRPAPAPTAQARRPVEAPAPSTQVATFPSDEGYWIQLGAFREADRPESLWRSLTRSHPRLLGPLVHVVTEATTPQSENTYYRLRAGPLPNLTVARRLCRVLLNAGRNCFVTER